MNKTLKKIIIIAIVSVVVYFGIVILLDYLDWMVISQYDGYFTLLFASLPSQNFLFPIPFLLIIITFLSAIFLFIKKMRRWLWYMFPLCVIGWLLVRSPLSSRYDLCDGVDAIGEYLVKYDAVIINHKRHADDSKICNKWGRVLLDTKGHVKECRSNSCPDLYYIVDIFSEGDLYIARIYDESLIYVKGLVENDYSTLKKKVETTLDCYIVEE